MEKILVFIVVFFGKKVIVYVVGRVSMCIFCYVIDFGVLREILCKVYLFLGNSVLILMEFILGDLWCLWSIMNFDYSRYFVFWLFMKSWFDFCYLNLIVVRLRMELIDDLSELVICSWVKGDVIVYLVIKYYILCLDKYCSCYNCFVLLG